MALAPDLSTGSGLGMVANPRQGGLSGMARDPFSEGGGVGGWAWNSDPLSTSLHIFYPLAGSGSHKPMPSLGQNVCHSQPVSPWGKQHDKAKNGTSFEARLTWTLAGFVTLGKVI